MRRVVITGIGIVSPFGVGKKVIFDGLTGNLCALRVDEELKTVVGRIPEKGEHAFILDKWTARELKQMSRGSALALLAAEEAVKDAGLEGKDLNETGVNIGMGVADLDLIYEVGKQIESGKARRVTPFFVPRILTNMPAGHVSIKYGMRGPHLSSCTACATGLHAVGDSATFIKMGRANRMLAGATEACVNSIAITGFKQMRAISSNGSRPFDKRRDGFILSEGAALLVLEKLEDAIDRKANIYAEITGYGCAGDAHHLTTPTEDGLGAYLSMQRCLNDAKLNLNDVNYVNAHATSTPLGDQSEAHAIARLMPSVAVSSIKGHIGHTLGAAGAIEVAITAMCVKEGIVVGNANLEESDIKEKIRLLKEVEKWPTPRVALINSFGFGGPHATLSLSSY